MGDILWGGRVPSGEFRSREQGKQWDQEEQRDREWKIGP